jgi:hypothetical protein
MVSVAAVVEGKVMEVFLGILLAWLAITAIWVICQYIWLTFVCVFAGVATCIFWIVDGAKWVRRQNAK